MTYSTHLWRALSTSILALLVACSGGSDPSPTPSTPAPNLTGSYVGSVYVIDGSVRTYSVEINGNQVTSVFADGSDTGKTATIQHGTVSGVTYFMTDSDGTDIGFTVTPNGRYIGMVVADPAGGFDVGILQKDAISPLAYNQQTFLGSWSGLQFELDSNLDILDNNQRYGSATVSTAADGSFVVTGLDANLTSSSNVNLDATYGNRGFATATALRNGVSMNVKTLLSTDGKAAASWVCAAGVPEDFNSCGFILLEKENTLLNVELKKTSTAANDATDRIFQFSFGQLSGNNIPCTITRPYNKAGVTCGLASYNNTSHLLSVPVSGIGDATTMTIDLSSAATMTVSTDGSINNSGQVKFAQAQLNVRTQAHKNGYEYTVVVLQNPDPAYRKAVLTGASSGATTLWNNNYASVIDSYFADDTDNGVPNATGAYVSINSSASKARMRAGVYYQVALSDYTDVSNPNKKQLYRFFYPSVSSMPTYVNMLPSRSGVSIDGNFLSTATNHTSALSIVDGPTHNITWTMPAGATAPAYWQVRLRVVNGSDDIHLNNREYRSGRIAANALLVQGNTYSWTAPWPISSILQDAGDVIKLQIRGSNSDNSLGGQSQGMFINYSAIAQN